jgi:hypothetical protein
MIILSRWKSLAALALAIATCAFAVPAATASATVFPPVTVFGPSSVTCQVLVGLLRGATLTGNIGYETGLGYALLYNGCGGAAI